MICKTCKKNIEGMEPYFKTEGGPECYDCHLKPQAPRPSAEEVCPSCGQIHFCGKLSKPLKL